MNKLIELIEKGNFWKDFSKQIFASDSGCFIAGMLVIYFHHLFLSWLRMYQTLGGSINLKDIETLLMTPYSYSHKYLGLRWWTTAKAWQIQWNRDPQQPTK